MLRDFVYRPDLSLIQEALSRFKLGESRRADVTLLKFEALTPDSFMWTIGLKEQRYYIYAEDYIPGLGHVKEVFDNYLQHTDWDLMPAKRAIDFKTSSPVAAASTYNQPPDVKEMMKYTIDSGHDFVFLARPNE